MKNSILLLIFLSISNVAYAAPKIPTTICAKNSTGALALRAKCKAGETKIANRSSLVGSQGPAGAAGTSGTNGINGLNGSNGAAGVDGAIRIYGDGSAGPLNVTTTTSWFNSPPANNNLQFTTCNIATSAVLTVPSGTIIRCNEAATIAGNIFVLPSPNGAAVRRTGGTASFVAPAYQPPGAFPGFSAPAAGEITLTGSGTLIGGTGGSGLNSLSGSLSGLQFYSQLLRGSFLSGGGGAASIGVNTTAFAGSGGGSFALISKQSISVTGRIDANAGSTSSPGAGGGAGGLLVVASGESVSVSGSGTLTAEGTDGADSDAAVAAGGGGGGGIIQIIAPLVPNQNDINTFTSVTPGAGGSNAINQSSSNIRQAGSGGGGFGGSGGAGGSASAVAGSQAGTAGTSGQVGYASAVVADPAAVLLY